VSSRRAASWSVGVVIPAQNEQSSIQRCIRSVVRACDAINRGVKQYCSGSSLLDAALITAHAAEGLLLFNIPLNSPGVSMCPSNWANSAFADTATTGVAFRGVRVDESALIGEPGSYLSRPGFWDGAIGPAACWAGGAISLVDAASRLKKKDPHSRAQLGALQSIQWGLDAILTQAGRQIDEVPADAGGEARTRALKVRQLIERWCTETWIDSVAPPARNCWHSMTRWLVNMPSWVHTSGNVTQSAILKRFPPGRTYVGLPICDRL
jgi:hypothetical protein